MSGTNECIVKKMVEVNEDPDRMVVMVGTDEVNIEGRFKISFKIF